MITRKYGKIKEFNDHDMNIDVQRYSTCTNVEIDRRGFSPTFWRLPCLVTNISSGCSKILSLKRNIVVALKYKTRRMGFILH